jgi:hypothetical protein
VRRNAAYHNGVDINRFILKRSPKNVLNVGRPSPRNQTPPGVI